MIQRAISHFPGIGPRRRRLLETRGLDSWEAITRQHCDVLRIGVETWRRIQQEAQRCEEACRKEDFGYLVKRLNPADHWRLLAQWFDKLTFFDIETTGCDWESETTTIVFYSGGQVYRFVKGENLAEALDLMQRAHILVSFNGNTFDVPRLLETFHIPAFPAAHVDLRWVCYHTGLTGGLKRIEQELGMQRPTDLDGVDGLEAVRLWYAWERFGDERARERLLRYCTADVVALYWITARILEKMGCDVACPSFEVLWDSCKEQHRPETQGKKEHSEVSEPASPVAAENEGAGEDSGTAPDMLQQRLMRQWQRWREVR